MTAKRSPIRSLAVKSTALFGDYFGFPFAANFTTPFGHGLFSKGFSTRVGNSGKHKQVKAAVVGGKEKDGSVKLETANGKEEDAKTAKKKTVKKKKASPKKKVSAASKSAHEEGVAEVPAKSTKLKRKKVSKVSN